MKKIICLLMSILIILTCAPISLAAEGDGSALNPYLIRNAQELMNINNDLDAHYKLANNIDMSKVKFTPIGNAESGAFTGSLDGNGYTISGLAIYSKPKYCGLFGYCNGEVKNLTLSNVHIEGGRFTGGIAGFLDSDGVITGCTVSGKISSDSTIASAVAGGMAGYCAGEITNCTNKADVSAVMTTDYSCDVIAGGIMGILDSEKEVAGCVNSGNVTTKFDRAYVSNVSYQTQEYHTGGIAGKAEGSSLFSGCVNNGSVFIGTFYCTTYGNFYIGGIVGNAEKTEMFNCINNGDLYCETDFSNRGRIGGMVGHCEVSGSFDGCKNFGKICASYYTGGIAAYINGDGNFYNCSNSGYIYYEGGYGAYYVGGIGGYIAGKTDAENCYNYSDIMLNEGCFTGGIIGYCYNGGSVSESANLGNITLGYSISNAAISGIAYGSNLLIDKCYNNSDISELDTSQSGYNRANDFFGIGGASATDCYSIGNICAGYRASNGPIYAISGASDKVGKDNYFAGRMIRNSLLDTSRYIFADTDYVSEDTCANCRGVKFPEKLSDSQMQNPDSFVGWDFEDTWIIDPNVNSGYPILRCFYGDFMLNESKATVNKGETLQLTAYDNHSAVSPQYYESNDSTVAKVSKNGLITAVGAGNCVVSAYLNDGRRANCIVYVTGEGTTQKVGDLTVNKTGAVYPNLNGKLSAKEYIMNIYSSDESVARVDEDSCSHFTVYGVDAGKTTVSAVTNLGNTFTWDVTVTSIADRLSVYDTSVNVGEQKAFSYSVYPANTQSKVFFTSSDESIVTVDENGMLTGVSKGVAVVTVETDNGLKQAANVTVYAPVKSLFLEKTSFTVTKGFTDKIIPVIDPVDTTDTIYYSSSNTSYVTVSADGVITARNAGTAVITVSSSSGKTAYCSVTVVNVESPVTGVSLNHSELTLNPGEITDLTVTVYPSDATYKNVRWSVDDADIATVSQTGVIKALSAGETTVRVTTSDGAYTAECKVNVVIDVEGVALSRSRIAMGTGETLALTARTLPESATNKNVTWSSANDDIASVDENGVVTANALGKTVISVESEDGNYTAECFVNVATDTYEVTWTVNNWILTEKYVYGEVIVQPEVAEKEGYHFIGWSAEVPETMVAENLAFVAIFEEHQPVSYGEDKAPTCTEDGSQKGEKCSVCEKILKEAAVLEKIAHSHELVNTVAATCTKAGKKTFTCSCGDTYTETITKLGHSYSSSYTIDTPATCTVDGSKSKHCTRTGCTGKKSVTAIPATGHAYDNACDTTCNICSEERTIKHDYAAATCTKAKTCKVCGKTSGSKLGHTYEKVTTTKATVEADGKISNICTACGYIASKYTVIGKPASFTLSTTEYTYNKTERKPKVTIKDSKGNKLVEGTDYRVGYEDGRILPGKYTVKITFKGNYDGVKRLYFTIKPRVTTEITATQTITTLTLNWKKVTGADGYRIYKYNSSTGEYDYFKTSTSTTLKLKDLTGGTIFKFKVRAYKEDEGKIYGSYSPEFETATMTKTPLITEIYTSKVGKAVVKWSDVDGESGFQLYYSTSKDGEFTKVKSYEPNKLSGAKTELKSGKTYYFKVRAYTKTASGTVFSKWSSVKSVKVK